MRRFFLHFLAFAVCAGALPAQQQALEVQLPGARTVTLPLTKLRALPSDTIRLVPHHGEPTLYRAATLAMIMEAAGLPFDSLSVA